MVKPRTAKGSDVQTEHLQNEVSGFLNKINKEKKAELKKRKVTAKFKSKNFDSNIKKKKFKHFIKSYNDHSSPIDENADVLSLPRALSNLQLPTQQLVSSYLPWYEVSTDEPIGNVDESYEFLNDLKLYAKKLFDHESEVYQDQRKRTQKNSSSSNWIKTAASAGTMKDRFNALSVLCQEAPMHNISSLESLINMCKKNVKRETLQGVFAIKDVLLKSFLPDNRRLRNFHQHPLDTVYTALTSAGESDLALSLEKCQQYIILWGFEDQLKQLVSDFITILSNLSKDTMDEFKNAALRSAWAILKQKPEGEKQLLGLIVNKLGDPRKKPMSYALHILHKLVAEHPMMQIVIVKAVRDLLLVPKLTIRAQYICINFMSAQMLSHDRKELAEALLEIYMNFFKSLMLKKNAENDEQYNKMMVSLLTGVSRAIPFVEMNETVLNQINEIYRAAHHPKINTVLRAISILIQILETKQENPDRFYNLLYRTLYHSDLAPNTNRHSMFLHLLFKALKFDSSEERRDAIIKRSLQATALHAPAFIAGLLTLISELMRAKPVFAQRLRYTPLMKDEDKKLAAFENDGDEDEHFYDVDEDDLGVKKNKNDDGSIKSSWVHRKEKGEEKTRRQGGYDPYHLNPRFCGVEKSSFWELHLLTRHFHPTVAIYAKTLLSPSEDSATVFSGDPLVDYSLIRFLERFSYRNPKTTDKKEGEVLKYHEMHSRMRFVSKSHRYDVPVNSIDFLKKEKFNPEDRFFQQYFSLPALQSRHRKKKRLDKEKEEEHEDLSDDEFDDFMQSAEGQKELNKEIKFFDHVSRDSDSKKKEGASFDDSDDAEDEVWGQDDVEDDERGMEEEQGESAGVFITGGNEESKKRKHRKMKSMKIKKQKMIGNELGEILAENVMNEFDTITSSATIVKDKSSAKQLRWERKRELKDILEKKRKRKRDAVEGKRSKKQSKVQTKSKKEFSKPKNATGKHKSKK